MKKPVVALTVLIFAVGLIVGSTSPVMALFSSEDEDQGYHEVYTWDGAAWVPIDAFFRECEMYSKTSFFHQYRFESNPAAPLFCASDYLDPEPEPPVDVYINNYAHVFPWIDVHFNQTNLIWDIFKPGDYMAKAFMIALRANCDVLIHFGDGSFLAPVGFEDGQDGEIIIDYVTPSVTGSPAAFDNKQREYSLLGKGSPGTPPDELEVMWWWKQGDADDWARPHEITDLDIPDKDDVVPSPTGGFPGGWVRAPDMNSDYTIVYDEEVLHEAKYIVFYEDIYLEHCVSEGKYFDQFVISICPDP